MKINVDFNYDLFLNKIEESYKSLENSIKFL